MVKALSELAPAADSNLYRASADATPTRLQLATAEMPLVVAKNIAYRVADLHPRTLSDGTPYYEWDYKGSGGAEDIHHAQFELGCLAVVLEGQLSAQRSCSSSRRTCRAGAACPVDFRAPGQHVPAHRMAQQPARRVASSTVPGDQGYTDECAGGGVPLAQFDPWVWTARPRHHVQRIVIWPPRGQPWGAAAVSKVQFHEIPDRLRGPELADHPGGSSP